MTQEYEQLSLDTAHKLERAIRRVADNAIDSTRKMIRCNQIEMTRTGHAVPGPVRNRHEAYGIAADQLARITGTVKSIKKNTAELLNTLSDTSLSAVEAVGAVCSSTQAAACVLIKAAAEIRRARDDLHIAEISETPEPLPMDTWMEAAGLQDAESVVDMDGDNTEMEDA